MNNISMDSIHKDYHIIVDLLFNIIIFVKNE